MILAKGSLSNNVLSNSGGFVASVLIAFLITPFIIRSIGDEGFGVWKLVSTLIGYYGLLDLGVRGAISHYTARYLAIGDHKRKAKAVATGFWALAAFGSIALVIGLTLLAAFPYIFEVGEIPVRQVRMVMLIMTVVFALNLPMAVFSGVLVGYERLDLINAIEISTRGIGALAIYITLSTGGSIVSLAVVQAGVSLAIWLLTIYSVRALMRDVSVWPGSASRDVFAELWHYGGRSMIVNVAVFIVYRTDLLVVGAFLGPKWVTVYAIGQMLVSYLFSAVGAITLAFTPRMTQLAGQGKDTELRQVYLKCTWLAACLILPAAGCLAAFGTSFIALWLESSYVSGAFWERSDIIMFILLVAQIPRMLQSSSWQLLYATRRQGYIAKITSFEALLNLTLSIVLVRQLGIVGVALGTLAPMLFTHIVLLPRYISRNLYIPAREVLTRSVALPALSGIGLWAFAELITHAIVPNTWALFLIEAALTTAVGIVLLYALALDDTEKQNLSRLLARLRGKIV